jgi:hypothetical protein
MYSCLQKCNKLNKSHLVGQLYKTKRNVLMSSTYLGFLTLQYVVIIPAILEYVRRETQMLVDLKTYITHLRTREFKQIRN